MKAILITIATAMFLALALPMEPAMAQGQPTNTNNAIVAARYTIVIDGVMIASFSSLDAITTGGQVIAGTTAPELGSVTLHRGVTGGLEMWAWHNAVAGGQAAVRKSASLIGYAADGTPVMRFFLTLAWPSKVEIGPPADGSSQALVETVTLTCTRIDRLAP
jgi:phage tail-like protein